jgi:hypothetical protein
MCSLFCAEMLCASSVHVQIHPGLPACNGSEIKFPNKAVPFREVTCAELDQLLLPILPEDERADIFIDINFASWCGCTGVETLDECFLCGPDEEVSDPEAIILDLNLTCGAVGTELAALQ